MHSTCRTNLQSWLHLRMLLIIINQVNLSFLIFCFSQVFDHAFQFLILDFRHRLLLENVPNGAAALQ
jgi:hypothetical protein